MIWCSILLFGFFSGNVALGSETKCALVPHGTISKETLPSDKSLKEINLSQCNIINIEDSAFSDLDQLEQLFLHNNSITEIRQNTFIGLSNLDILGLKNNQINRIEDGALNLPKLTILYLRGNQLTTLSDTVFNKLPNLIYIDLTWNKLEHIGKSLNSLQKVSDVFLDQNEIEDIDLKEFAKLPALNHLTLIKSGFDWTTQADVSDDFITSVNSKLSGLDVSNNNITDSSFIHKLKVFRNLEVLIADENPFEEIIWDASIIKENFPKLIRIVLRKIKLSSEHIRGLYQAFQEKNIELYF